MQMEGSMKIMEETKVIIGWVQSWYWVAPPVLLLCQAKLNQHKCAKMHLQGVLELWMASIPGNGNFRPKHETYILRTHKDLNLLWKTPQIHHLFPSDVHPIPSS